MTYICMECGCEVSYEELIGHKIKCTKCSEKRSNIWMKKRIPSSKIIYAR
ncbi:MAG: DNA-directed RNA polymerase subunit P [Candidatus Altiarchaeota archaeon]